jgi:hypothetical protein
MRPYGAITRTQQVKRRQTPTLNASSARRSRATAVEAAPGISTRAGTKAAMDKASPASVSSADDLGGAPVASRTATAREVRATRAKPTPSMPALRQRDREVAGATPGEACVVRWMCHARRTSSALTPAQISAAAPVAVRGRGGTDGR